MVYVADCNAASLSLPANVPNYLLSSWDAMVSEFIALRDDIFTSSNVNCPIDTCEILDGIGNPMTLSGSTSLKHFSHKFHKLWANHEVAGGFIESIKVRCTLFGGGGTSGTSTSNLFQVQLADCTNVVDSTGTIAPQYLSYTGSYQDLYFTPNSLFNN